MNKVKPNKPKDNDIFIGCKNYGRIKNGETYIVVYIDENSNLVYFKKKDTAIGDGSDLIFEIDTVVALIWDETIKIK